MFFFYIQTLVVYFTLRSFEYAYTHYFPFLFLFTVSASGACPLITYAAYI